MQTVSDTDILLANEKGHLDFAAGLAQEENPYRHTPVLFRAWAEGHEAAYQHTYQAAAEELE